MPTCKLNEATNLFILIYEPMHMHTEGVELWHRFQTHPMAYTTKATMSMSMIYIHIYTVCILMCMVYNCGQEHDSKAFSNEVNALGGHHSTLTGQHQQLWDSGDKHGQELFVSTRSFPPQSKPVGILFQTWWFLTHQELCTEALSSRSIAITGYYCNHYIQPLQPHIYQ